jgi:hypothetical protein
MTRQSLVDTIPLLLMAHILQRVGGGLSTSILVRTGDSSEAGEIIFKALGHQYTCPR